MSSVQAVQVVAQMGPSVVAVERMRPPQSAEARRFQRGLLIAGGGLLTLSAALFGAAAVEAASDTRSQQAWLEAGKNPNGWRPTRPSPARDGVALGSLLVGLAALSTGLWRRPRGDEREALRIGAAADCTFAGDVPAPLTLLRRQGSDFLLDTRGLDGEVLIGQTRTAVTAAAPCLIPMTSEVRATLTLGRLTYHVSPADDGPVVASGLGQLGTRGAAFIAASAVVHAGLLFAAFASEVDTMMVNTDLGSIEPTDISAQGTAQDDDVPPEPTDGAEAAANGDRGDAPNASMLLTSGTTGADQPIEGATRRRQIANTQDAMALARQEAIAQASSAGVLGVAAADAFQSVLGTDSVSSGFDAISVTGGWQGEGVGVPMGWGHGPSGRGPGGGGLVMSVTVGGYRTFGGGPPGGDGYTLGPSGGKCTGKACGNRTGRVPPPKLGKPDPVEGYDRDIVRRYVRQRLAAIGACYERQLLVDATLAGTVIANFSISPTGAVVSSSATGVAPAVSGCIADVISTIKFPAPDSFGLVKIRYPFDLRSAGTGS